MDERLSSHLAGHAGGADLGDDRPEDRGFLGILQLRVAACSAHRVDHSPLLLGNTCVGQSGSAIA